MAQFWTSQYERTELETGSRVKVEHDLVNTIRALVRDYRFSSFTHYCLHINVKELSGSNVIPIGSQEVKIPVEFANYSRTIRRICRPGKTRTGIEIKERSRWVPLRQALEKYFPPESANPTHEKLQDWWSENGQTFHWAGLPTELKEQILQFCLLPPVKCRGKSKQIRDYFPGNLIKLDPYEITNQLGEHQSLLAVCRQVRAILLRLCLLHSVVCPGGLMVSVASSHSLQLAMRRLGNWYQMTEVNGVPLDHTSRAEAKLYFYYPKIYPELIRYATMKHGIRKLSLRFDLRDAMLFFKVFVAGFDRLRPAKQITCDILDQLPNLHSVHVQMPTNNFDEPKAQCCITLLCPDMPCYRTLQRFIYERMAQVLAPYKNVQVTKLLDAEEERRFWRLRREAVIAQQLRDQELLGLYSDLEGGVMLESHDCVPLEDIGDQKGQPSESISLPEVGDEIYTIFPPICKCAIRCKDLLYPKYGRGDQ